MTPTTSSPLSLSANARSMVPIFVERLEDAHRDWWSVCAKGIEECVHDEVLHLSGRLPDPVGPVTPVMAAHLADVNRCLREWSEKTLLSQCLAWMRETKRWPDSVSGDGCAHSELTAALQNLPSFEMPVPEPTFQVPAWSSAVAAASGAFLGMLLLTPLTLLLLGQRETGLFAGGIIGSASLVALVGILAKTPRVRAALAFALPLAAAGSLLGGLWSYWRGNSTSWLRASLGLLATGFVILLSRPQPKWPAREEFLKHIRKQIHLHLREVAELVLAWCWAHPARLSLSLHQKRRMSHSNLPVPSGTC
jgi:hypothetical protein